MLATMAESAGILCSRRSLEDKQPVAVLYSAEKRDLLFLPMDRRDEATFKREPRSVGAQQT